MFPFASSLVLLPDKQPSDVRLRVVARSTPASTFETTDAVDLQLRQSWTSKPPVESRAVAAYALGRLRSAFADLPQREPAVPLRAPSSSRVLVVASSQFLTNPFVYAGNGPGTSGGDPSLLTLAQPYTANLTSTILAVKNSLDWTMSDETLSAVDTSKCGAHAPPASLGEPPR